MNMNKNIESCFFFFFYHYLLSESLTGIGCGENWSRWCYDYHWQSRGGAAEHSGSSNVMWKLKVSGIKTKVVENVSFYVKE